MIISCQSFCLVWNAFVSDIFRASMSLSSIVGVLGMSVAEVISFGFMPDNLDDFDYSLIIDRAIGATGFLPFV